MTGTVVKSTGSWYNVLLENGKTIPCRIKGKFRLDNFKVTNPVAVGDIVDVELEEHDEVVGNIYNIHPRKNYVVRQSPRKKHFLHLLASNIDQAVLIATVKDPMLKPGFIDRFLMMTEPYNIPVTIVFNKIDLYDEGEMELAKYMAFVYEDIGYNALLVSAEDGRGLDDLKAVLKDKQTLISGQSGVGKSTIINAIQPHLDLKTGTLSDYSGKGQHTTTFAEMYGLDFGGTIIDTPGIKNLTFSHLEEQDVVHNFVEIFRYSEHCKFSNCTHRNEPKCAVKEAVENQEISILRYENYLQILSEVEDQNYWERHEG